MPQGASRCSTQRRAQSPKPEKARKPKRVCVPAAGAGGATWSSYFHERRDGRCSCSTATDCWSRYDRLHADSTLALERPCASMPTDGPIQPQATATAARRLRSSFAHSRRLPMVGACVPMGSPVAVAWTVEEKCLLFFIVRGCLCCLSIIRRTVREGPGAAATLRHGAGVESRRPTRCRGSSRTRCP